MVGTAPFCGGKRVEVLPGAMAVLDGLTASRTSPSKQSPCTDLLRALQHDEIITVVHPLSSRSCIEGLCDALLADMRWPLDSNE